MRSAFLSVRMPRSPAHFCRGNNLLRDAFFRRRSSNGIVAGAPAAVVRPECPLLHPTQPVGRLQRSVPRGLGTTITLTRVKRRSHRVDRLLAVPLDQQIPITRLQKLLFPNCSATRALHVEIPAPIFFSFSPTPVRVQSPHREPNFQASLPTPMMRQRSLRRTARHFRHQPLCRSSFRVIHPPLQTADLVTLN